MGKFSHVSIDGQSKWIEFYKEDIFIMHKTPLDKDFQRDSLVELKDRNLKFLPPSDPTKVIGVGWNYKDLVGEQDSYPEPIVFLKSPTSICPHESCIKYPKFAEKVWVEVEIVIVIGKECSNVKASEAQKYILGHTLGSDISALNILERDWHLARSKAIDQFAPLGKYLITDINTDNLALESTINDREAQLGNSSFRILNDNQLIELISSIMTLYPGDIIFTGTPAGATEAIVRPGDKVMHKVDTLGELNFTIV